MIGIVLLSLLGVGLSAFAIDEFRNSDDDNSARNGPRDEPEEPDESGEPDQPSQTGIFFGTDGNDVITNDTLNEAKVEGRLEEVRAGAGDDRIALSDYDVDVYGEDGNDRIAADKAYGQILDGGAGNDTITALDASATSILGGDGDDSISILADSGGEEPAFASGGAGDDTLDASITTADGRITSLTYLEGGTGDDIFNLRTSTNHDAYQISGPEYGFDIGSPDADGNLSVDSGVMATITDFEKGSDVLNVDLRNLDLEEVSSSHIFRGAELSESEGGTNVNLTFEALRPDSGSETYELISTIRLEGVTGLTLDDINFQTDAAPDVLGNSGDNMQKAGANLSYMALDGGDNALATTEGDNPTIATATGDSVPDHLSGDMLGGQNADVFDLTLQLVASEFSETQPNGANSGGQGIVPQDFTPGEDMLTVQIDRAESGEDRDMISADIGRDDDGYATLMMTFAATATHPETQATMRLGDNAHITLDDIAFIQT